MIVSNVANTEQPPVGTHVAFCTSLIDIGTQKREWQGSVKMQRRIRIGWQLPTVLRTQGDKEGQPFMVTEFFTASLSENAALYHMLVNWRGKKFSKEELSGFNLANILAKPCLLALNEHENGNVGYGGVMNLPKGMPMPQMIGGTQYLSLEPSEFNEAVFQNLSPGIKAMIEASPEYQFIKTGVNVHEHAPDDGLPPLIEERVF